MKKVKNEPQSSWHIGLFSGLELTCSEMRPRGKECAPWIELTNVRFLRAGPWSPIKSFELHADAIAWVYCE